MTGLNKVNEPQNYYIIIFTRSESDDFTALNTQLFPQAVCDVFNRHIKLKCDYPSEDLLACNVLYNYIGFEIKLLKKGGLK